MDLYRLGEACLHGLTDSEKLVYMDLYRLGEACLHGLIQTVEKLVHVIVYKDVCLCVTAASDTQDRQYTQVQHF